MKEHYEHTSDESDAAYLSSCNDGGMDQATYRRLKTRLTRAENAHRKAQAAETAIALRAEARHGMAAFDFDGSWPDDWSRWERANNDAEFFLRRASW